MVEVMVALTIGLSIIYVSLGIMTLIGDKDLIGPDKGFDLLDEEESENADRL